MIIDPRNAQPRTREHDTMFESKKYTERKGVHTCLSILFMC